MDWLLALVIVWCWTGACIVANNFANVLKGRHR